MKNLMILKIQIMLKIFYFLEKMFDIKKVESYLFYCFKKKDFINKYFLNKCKKLNYDISNFRSIKKDLNSISETRTSQKFG